VSEYGDLKTLMPMWNISVTLLKSNFFCAISSQKVYGPSFFAEETVAGMTYLDMATVAKHTDVHIPARQKSRPLPL
jgi:hypothetical protein